MTTPNWDRTFTHVATLNEFRHEHGEERVKHAIHALYEAGGSFAVSDNKLYLSDFSYQIIVKLHTDWTLAQPTKGTP